MNFRSSLLPLFAVLGRNSRLHGLPRHNPPPWASIIAVILSAVLGPYISFVQVVQLHGHRRVLEVLELLPGYHISIGYSQHRRLSVQDGCSRRCL